MRVVGVVALTTQRRAEKLQRGAKICGGPKNPRAKKPRLATWLEEWMNAFRVLRA